LYRGDDAQSTLEEQNENTVGSIWHSAGELNGLDTFQRYDRDR